jgi:predicted nucleic acid-binding protein
MIYLDTSVAVGLFVPEAKTASIEAWFAACPDVLVSADWIVTEFASALSLKERRGVLTAGDAHAAWTEFGLFCGTGLRLVPVSRDAFEAAARLARDAASGLRSGDSLHLAMALELGVAAIATGDAVLEANARKHGLAVIGF